MRRCPTTVPWPALLALAMLGAALAFVADARLGVGLFGLAVGLYLERFAR